MKEDLFTRNFILLHSLFLLLLISARIEILRYIIGKIRGKEKNIRNMLIIGTGETGKNFEQMINEHPEFGYNISGFLNGGTNEEYLLGKVNDLDNLLTELNIDGVVIALSIDESSLIDEIVKICNKHAVRIHIIPDYFRFVSKKFQVNMIGDFPIITVRREPLSEAHWRFIKRSFDLLFSAGLFILIFSWLFPLIALVLKLTSKGKVFFLQERIGSRNKIFKCYKFRTMKSNLPVSVNFQPVIKNDPRITGPGKFLRRSNLDELPQFINVIKGEMSIVGPRPHAVAYNKVYKEMIEEINIRGWVKPGITGWAQIHGLRGDVPDFEENRRRTRKRIEHDLWYIENWSIWLDIQIILLTIWQMIKGKTRGI
jgi:putative colanic acid biosynthesis UDP-glucose lipid carrier transferase